MKQQITTDQWKEPSNEGRQKWREWSYSHKYVQEDKDGAIMPMPTIGQMAEFIKEKKPRRLLTLFPTNPYLEDVAIIECFNKLCDLLWEAVKQNL